MAPCCWLFLWFPSPSMKHTVVGFLKFGGHQSIWQISHYSQGSKTSQVVSRISEPSAVWSDWVNSPTFVQSSITKWLSRKTYTSRGPPVSKKMALKYILFWGRGGYEHHGVVFFIKPTCVHVTNKAASNSCFTAPDIFRLWKPYTDDTHLSQTPGILLPLLRHRVIPSD